MSDFFLGLLSGSGILLVIVIFFIMNPEKLDKWLAIIMRLLNALGFKFKRQQVKRDIQGAINSFVKTLSKESGINRVGVKIKWAGRAEDEDVQWKEGQVVLVIRDRNHKSRNFVHAAYLFVSTSLLRSTKLHLSKKQSIAIDVFTTGKIIQEENPPALDYYNNDIANPLLGDAKVRESIKKFEDIDKSGFYTNILLQELNYLGNKVILGRNRDEVYKEVNALINFLQNFATREVGDTKVPEEFVGKFLKTSIKIVAKQSTRDRGNTQGPADSICRAFDKGIENIYVIGPHEGGKAFIRKVCDTVKVKITDIDIVKSRSFKGLTTKEGKSTPTVTHMIQLRKGTSRKFIEDEDVQKQIETYKNEIDNKTIEIVKD